MPTKRFLLIKAIGHSIWADVDHVICQIFAAELTGRVPVVYWGIESMYSVSMNSNSFESFFEPVSGYSIEDVIQPEASYYPPSWNFQNALADDTDKLRMDHRDLKGMMESNADVLISDIYYPISAMLPWVGAGHWAFGKTPIQIYRTLYEKYLKLQPETNREIQKFINTNPNFRDERPIIGVHVRENAVVNEVAQLYDLNEFYKPRIWDFIVRYNARHIFVITDSPKLFRQYKKLYSRNGLLMYTDSKKELFQPRVMTCLLDYPNKRHKGAELRKDTVEIIKDTYLAAQCDFFVGNGYSSLSNAVMHLKDWPESNIRLLY